MTKRILIILAVILTVLILIEIMSLLRLGSSLAGYARFWKQRSALQGEFVYVALGDSTAQSIGASEPLHGYVGILAKKIETKIGKKVRIVNLSVSGATVQDLIDKQLPELKNYQPDLITVGIGANDVARNNMDDFPAHYDSLAKSLPKNTFVTNMPYFGGRLRRNAEAIKASEIIKSDAERYQLKLVNLQDPLRAQNSILNYASDLFHPSNRAYRIWADAFWQKIEPTL
ncbi:SGNH/GDSL hydrolase family protein [Candidatus Saccharibacteria bacterium]|nr:SGNH/GDSL hydrolase family protein [Candidatus Saccharibacteria bacterium]